MTANPPKLNRPGPWSATPGIRREPSPGRALFVVMTTRDAAMAPTPPGTRRLVQADAEAFIRDYGPDGAYLAARGLARQALDRRRAAHWRRAGRAVARMTAKIVDY